MSWNTHVVGLEWDRTRRVGSPRPVNSRIVTADCGRGAAATKNAPVTAEAGWKEF
jgi:hypothetical protein